jgi:hypothetical protein
MKQAAYSAFGVEGEISSVEILADPDSFKEALKYVFGDGYVFAERSIIREMKKKFSDLDSPASYYGLNEALRIAGRRIRECSRGSQSS